MIIILVIAVVLLLTVCLGIVAQVAVSDFGPVNNPATAAMVSNAHRINLPPPVQQYLHAASVAQRIRSPYIRFLVNGFRNLLNRFHGGPALADALFYNALSRYMADRDNMAYCLFPDARLAYIYSPDTGSGQLLRFTPVAPLKIVLEYKPMKKAALQITP